MDAMKIANSIPMWLACAPVSYTHLLTALSLMQEEESEAVRWKKC